MPSWPLKPPPVGRTRSSTGGLRPGLSRVAAALWAHYSAPPQQIMKRFRDGLIYFAVGLMTVLMANLHMPPSVGQELLVLAGLLLAAVGFLMAMLAEVRFVISRLFRLFDEK